MHNTDMTYPPLDSPELRTILRPAQEPMRHVDDAHVHSLLLSDPVSFLAFLEDALREIAIGSTALTLPPKEVFEDGPEKGDFRVMPCVTRNTHRTVKTVKIVGTNLAQCNVPDQVTVGKAMLLHPEENYVTHLFDANALSSIRTGACVALAIRLLAPQRQRLLFLGAGRVGFYSAVFALALGGIEAMHISDIDAGRAGALASMLASKHAGVDFTFGPVAPDHRADVVVLATTGTVPLCHPPGWGARLVVSVGADTDFQHELDPAWAGCADIFVDTRDSARFGDLRQWLDRNLIRSEDLCDLLSILRGEYAAMKPRLFVSTGSALFDNLTIAYLADRLPSSMSSLEIKSSSL